MKGSTLCIISIVLAFLISCGSPQQPMPVTDPEPIATDRDVYDSLTAQEYGADPYGMKKYVVAFLNRGPNRDLDSARAAELQTAHLKNIQRMAEEGKLVLAGPFMDDGDLRGIYIFNVSSIEEAEALTNTDPAIMEGSLKMDLKEWYGSAALMAVNELHQSISQQNIVD